MKRLAIFFCVVGIFFVLSGCSAKEAIASDKQEYIVSSIGFDNANDDIKIIIEAVVVNTDDLKEQKETRIITGEGENPDEAYGNIISKITQPLSLGHNAVTVIGESITPEQLELIFEFLKETPQINIATMLIFSENAEELLSQKAVSSVAVGYDIMSMIEVGEEKQGTVFKNRLYEVVALNSKPMKTFWIPHISFNDEGIYIKGLAVFKENKMLRFLNNEQTVAFSLITDTLTRGEIVVSSKKIRTQYCKVTYDFDTEKIEVNVRLKAQGDKEIIKAEAQKLLEKEDVFGLGNIIYQKEPKLWEKIKDDYAKFYEKADKRVNFYE